MKTKINVTVEEEESVQNQINEDKIKDILSKLKNNQSGFLMKKYTTMVINDDKIKLKKGKWFKKFKSIPLINIEKSYILENCQELILLTINFGKISGYIVLRINIASNLMDFVDILNKVLNHHHTIIPKGSIYYEVDEGIDLKVTTKEEEQPGEIDDNDNDVNYDNNPIDIVDSSNLVVIENGDNKSLKSTDKDQIEPNNTYEIVEKNKILRMSNNTDEFTYININSTDSFINDIGPVALFSQTFPSSYTINNDTNNNESDSDSETESDSQNEKDQQFM